MAEMNIQKQENTTKKFICMRIPDIGKFERYSNKSYPSQSKGVYILFKEDKIVYIGITIHIKSRLSQHRSLYNFDYYLFHPNKDNLRRSIVEAVLIRKYKPPFNNKWSRF
jgi:hypothetical protein